MFKKNLSIPLLKQAEVAYKTMTPSERWVFYALSCILTLSVIIISSNVYLSSTVIVPEAGGKITEGVVGAPRFINPVLAISQTDKDLSALIYASLMTVGENGKLAPELAASYSISDDAKEYTFILKDNLTFHDGTPLTSDDIIFTIDKALQPDIKSPERVNWEGVSVEKDGDLTVKFKLTKPYAQFLQNTTMGILPEEHWSKLSADEFIFSNLNTSPIGSGPYKFVSMAHDNSGIPSSIELARFKDFVLGAPYIKSFILKFYSNREDVEQALINKDVSSISEVSPHSVATISEQYDYNITTSTLPRIFAIFFNQAHNKALASKSVRKALRGVIDKQVLINNVLASYAEPIDAPMLNSRGETAKDVNSVLTLQEAKSLIEAAGWKMDDDTKIYNKDDQQLAITLTTANSAELKEVVEYIAGAWRTIGVVVKLEIFEPGDIAHSVLRQRDYDALLFGEILGVDPDLYAFWHSSQRNDPGLNIANYANSTVDKLLIKARKTTDSLERGILYKKLTDEVNSDVPAIFLYAPDFIYMSDNKIRGIHFPSSMEPHERFSGIHKWHVSTNRTLQLLNK